jgi:hypothetical protein
MWNDGTVLCGQSQPKRFWMNWTMNALNWSDIVCQACVQTWLHPSGENREEHFALPEGVGGAHA